MLEARKVNRVPIVQLVDALEMFIAVSWNGHFKKRDCTTPWASLFPLGIIKQLSVDSTTYYALLGALIPYHNI